jgi:hypothetical protein
MSLLTFPLNSLESGSSHTALSPKDRERDMPISINIIVSHKLQGNEVSSIYANIVTCFILLLFSINIKPGMFKNRSKMSTALKIPTS